MRGSGVGFGKPLPGIVYRNEMPASLLAVEPQALTHAHNLFINTWLQTGFIGVVLQTVLLLCLVARFWRLRRVEALVVRRGHGAGGRHDREKYHRRFHVADHHARVLGFRGPAAGLRGTSRCFRRDVA